MNKKDLNETEICDQLITPAIAGADWEKGVQIRREVRFPAGRVIVRGKVAVRGEQKRADYVLYLEPNLPPAVVEAKDNNHPMGGGMQQALAYADALDVPFIFSSNGDGFLFHDRTGQRARQRSPRSPSTSSPRLRSSGAGTVSGRASHPTSRRSSTSRSTTTARAKREVSRGSSGRGA